LCLYAISDSDERLQQVVHNLFPTKDNYVTEATSGAWISDPVTKDFEMITQSMRNWSKSFVKWGLALDENRGPHLGGCTTCTPLVTVNSTTGAVTYEIDYYTLGHFSKYVLPGATRIYSSNATGMVSAAFLNPDGSKALVAFNDTNADKTFQVAWGTQSFRYTLPPFSGATFTWSGTQSGNYRIPATSKIQASSYNDVFGLQTETTSDADGGYDLGFSINGSYAIYKSIEFGTGVTGVEARVANAGMARNGSTIEFRLDRLSGPLIASVAVPDTGGFQNWTTVSGTSTGASGTHDIYVVFNGDGTNGNLNWFRFR
jgi:glucosylceramidase